MSEKHVAPSRVAKKADASILYQFDDKNKVALPVGKVFVDEQGDAWVRINGPAIAERIGVEDIDGVALLNKEQYEAMEEEDASERD